MMETTDDHYMEVEETGEENEITVDDNDVSVRLSDETWQHLSISEGPSSGHRKVKVRPKLRCMKSFPPYSQCIGGLGQEKDDEQDGETQSPPENSTPYVTHKPCLTPREWRSEEVQLEQEALGTERKDMETDAMCKGEELRAKWRGRRRERLGGSNGADMEGWERRQRWSGKRKTGEARGERQHGSKEEEGKNTDGERNHWRSSARVNSGVQGKEAEDDERRGCAYSEMEGEGEGSGKTVRKSQEGEGLLVRREGSMNPWPTPHPILSRLLHSSSSTSTSSSSSMNLSSAESDDVFSEGEDAGSKRKTFRKVRVAGS
ncbi:uncharacterized protein LOC115366290 [Myripristis murdjan]|uniref:uncharacterized protein LOC115366290 n=1 Tax=Myripristis murdjan TaxID=586833 RepID=UPI001175EDF4|nr:uncharacterized protein LOC115366290 [Myripristis murdjan]